MSTGFNRNTRGDDLQRNDKVDRVVNDLVKSKLTDYEAWRQLSTKYPDNRDFMIKALDAYKEKLKHIHKKAKKFKQHILERYRGMNLSEGALLKKAKKYARKYKFSDSEFDLFYILMKTDSSSKYVMTIPTTSMAKTLGYDMLVPTTTKLHVKANEQSVVEEIVNKFGETKPLHAQTILQTLTYQDCAPEALSGKFDPSRDNAYAYIHPIVAALFLPKIEALEQQILLSNIGYIVQRKVTDTPIATLPDWKLYYDMIMDPNDRACTLKNPIHDLKNRYMLQCQLWDSVLKLRQGKYYYSETSGLVRFMQSIDNCRNVIHDAPDLTYVKDEGTILRRILSAFSLYPTYVSVTKLWNQYIGTAYGIPSTPFDNPYSNVTQLPMVTLRLPFSAPNGQATQAVSIEESLTQPQWYVENGTIVPKSFQIIHSNDVLFFYVGRRYQQITTARLGVPCNFTNLPMSVSGWESLNEHPVNAPRHLTVTNDTYELRSVVCVEKARVNSKSLIVGSSAMIVIPMNPSTGRYDETCVLYNPQCAGSMYKADANYKHGDPISVIPSSPSFMGNVDGVESFEQRACKRGTIFMYQKIVTPQPC